MIPILVLAALVIAGCGSSSSSPPASSDRGAELSYFPSGSPFVMSIVTDPNASSVRAAQSLVGQFPIATFGETALMTMLKQHGIDYHSDIRPLFGNPVVFGAPGTSLSGASTSQFVAVWVTKDAGKLTALIKKLGLHGAGSHDGATLYQGGGASTVAIDGATAVIGASQRAVTSALDRHAHGGGISSAAYSQASAGLPQDALIETFGNLSGVLSKPSAANALRVPWVAALRGYAASISATSTGLTFQYRLDTSGGALTAAQLPIASGSAAPALAGTLPITVGIKDPAQVVTFAEAAEQATSPAGYAAFLKRDAAARAKTGVDLNSMLKLLTGDLIIASDTHTWMGRAMVSDPAAAAQALAKIAGAPRTFFNRATRASSLGGGFYAIKEPQSVLTIGLVGNQLVAGKATVSQLRGFATAPTAPAAGAQGSVAFSVALTELLHIAIKGTPPQIVQTILNSLGDITGWAAASPSGLTGSATLALK